MAKTESEPIQTAIHDEDPSTEGGPPAWLAWAVVAGLFLAAGMVLALLWAAGVFV